MITQFDMAINCGFPQERRGRMYLSREIVTRDDMLQRRNRAKSHPVAVENAASVKIGCEVRIDKIYSVLTSIDN
jgi:hypothetical protein